MKKRIKIAIILLKNPLVLLLKVHTSIKGNCFIGILVNYEKNNYKQIMGYMHARAYKK